MDLRIVNTCNNHCLYCLEWSLRSKEKYLDKTEIFQKIMQTESVDNITFYGWNSLLHPDLSEIVLFSKNFWFQNIWLLSNGFWINESLLAKLTKCWLNTFGIYFHSFHQKSHEIITGKGIPYDTLLENLELLGKYIPHIRVIIHINGLNISRLKTDILILIRKYGLRDFDFVNYYPFDRPYTYREILAYDIDKKRGDIDAFLSLLSHEGVRAHFVKFARDFFGNYGQFYDYHSWILAQIWEEDIERLGWESPPICYHEKKCKDCFLRDYCQYESL